MHEVTQMKLQSRFGARCTATLLVIGIGFVLTHSPGYANQHFSCEPRWIAEIQKMLDEGESTAAYDALLNLAEAHCQEAQLMLEIYLAVGRGLPQDEALAAEWYRRAAEQGVVAAQYALGSAYLGGFGVEQNIPEAQMWLNLAAEQGEFMAARQLGVLYLEGSDVPQDLPLAYFWFSLAAPWYGGLVEQLRLEVEGKLSAEDVAQVKQRLAAWREKHQQPDPVADEPQTLEPGEYGFDEFVGIVGRDPFAAPPVEIQPLAQAIPMAREDMAAGRFHVARQRLAQSLEKSQADHPMAATAMEIKTAAEQARAQAPQRVLQKLELVQVPGGRFMMGDSSAGPEQQPVQEVSIKPFLLGKYEVTFEQYDLYCHAEARQCPDDEGWGRGDRPVINVSWYEANRFIRWLNEGTGLRFRLLSEAEWEYAARAGTRTHYPWGDEMQRGLANCMHEVCGGPEEGTLPVGSYPPNRFGLYDMQGNVTELVADCWYGSHEGAPVDGGVRSRRNCRFSVIRGGHWADDAIALRSAARYAAPVGLGGSWRGFRLALDPWD